MEQKRAVSRGVSSVSSLCDHRKAKATVNRPVSNDSELVRLVELQAVVIQHMLECPDFEGHQWCDHVEPLLEAVASFKCNKQGVRV